jgi:hypothetical protein
MTRVNNADHVLLLLRERLQRLDRGRGARAARAGASRAATPGPMARLQARAALDQVSGDEFRRTLVRALLTEEVGEAVANDPSFQAIVEDVFRMISATEDGRELIDRAGRELRAEA